MSDKNEEKSTTAVEAAVGIVAIIAVVLLLLLLTSCLWAPAIGLIVYIFRGGGAWLCL